jgi:hypothetical protein
MILVSKKESEENFNVVEMELRARINLLKIRQCGEH